MFHLRVAFTLLLCLAGLAQAQIPPPPGEKHTGVERPKSFVAQKTVDLGTMVEGDKASAVFIIENQGTTDLIIQQTKTGCGCAVVRLEEDEKVIHPDADRELKVDFDSQGRQGKQSKTIEVFTNDPVEPKLELTLTADVQSLFRLDPKSGLVRVRNVQRGKTADKPLDVYAGEGQSAVELLDVKVLDHAPMDIRHEPFTDARGRQAGRRLWFTITRDAPLGLMTYKALLTIKVGDVVREREIIVAGKVVGDLFYSPTILQAVDHPSRRGQRLTRIILNSPQELPFEVLGAEAGPQLEVEVEPNRYKPQGTEYFVHLTVREDAPPGPFGSVLTIRTDSLDEPMVRIPVYAEVQTPVEIEPPMVMLRKDNTQIGEKRLLRLRADVREVLQIDEATCDNRAVSVMVDTGPDPAYRHIRYLEVTLAGDLPQGRHEATLKVLTNIEDATELRIPVTIMVP